VPDLQRVVARLFRAALWGGAGCIVAGGGIDLLGFTRVASVVALLGVGIVVAAPFVILVSVAIVGRRTPTARWAIASLLVAALGYVLAR